MARRRGGARRYRQRPYGTEYRVDVRSSPAMSLNDIIKGISAGGRSGRPRRRRRR